MSEKEKNAINDKAEQCGMNKTDLIVAAVQAFKGETEMIDTNSPVVVSGTNDSYTLPRRHFKFRAWADGKMWSFENKKWLVFEESGYIAFSDELAGSEDEISDNLFDTEFHLMQYTNIRDKNFKEIYEGDIVRVSGILSNFETGETMDLFGVVFFGGGTWYIRYHENCSAELWENTITTEVVGNIFEHPELLERV